METLLLHEEECQKDWTVKLFFLELHTWENLAEKVHFLLEVSMRELLMGWLHKVLAGVEEILEQEQGKTTTTDQCYNDRTQASAKPYCREQLRSTEIIFSSVHDYMSSYLHVQELYVSNLDGIETAVLPGEFQQRHQCLQ